MSDQGRSRGCGAIQRRSAAIVLGLLLGIGFAMTWPRGAHAGDAACRGDGSGQDIFCQALDASFLLNLSDGTKMVALETLQPRQTPAAIVRVAQNDRSYQVVANGSPPTPTIISQIHNAPGWRHSTGYTSRNGPFTRVVNGPGWDETSATYKPGQPLNVYQLTSARLLHVRRQWGTSRHRLKYHRRHLHLEISLAGRLHLHYWLDFRQPALEERDSILVRRLCRDRLAASCL